MRIRSKWRFDSGWAKLGGMLVAGALLITGSIAVAKTVTLKAGDGSITVSGAIKSFDGRIYVLNNSAIGELKLNASKFKCIAGECPPAPASFGIHGSNTIGAQLMPALIEAYAQSLEGRTQVKGGRVPEEVEMRLTSKTGRELATITLHSHGSGTAAPGLATKQAMIGMMSRPIKDKEHKALEGAGFGDMRSPGREHILGLDALLVLVAPRNQVSSLTVEQVSQIFSGKIKDWSELGRAPGRINVYSRDFKSGTYDTFNSLVLKPYKNKLSKDAKLFESTPDLADSVARDPNGIGFVGYAYQRNAKALSITNECGMNIEPKVFNVKTEEYPLSRRLFLYTPPLKKDSFAAKLLRFSLSKPAQSAINRAGFVDQGINMLAKIGQIARLSDVKAGDDAVQTRALVGLAGDLKKSVRLSTTFRFRFGSSDLDNKAIQDVAVLAEFVRFLEARQPGSQLLLIGFSDGVGSFESNLALSVGRARAVRSRLLDAVNSEKAAKLLGVRGYGSILPVACDSSEAGRAKNRRVEVWLR